MQVRSLLDPLREDGPVWLKHYTTVAAFLARRNAARRPVALVPLHYRGHRYPKPLGHYPAALACRQRGHHTLSQIVRIGSGHSAWPPTPVGSLNHKSQPLGIPIPIPSEYEPL